jgi:hypothetical protein
VGKKPKRTSSREVRASAQQTAIDVQEVEIPYYVVTPESSTIIDAAYSPDTETLVVKFRHNDSIYAYGKFPQALWLEFVAAESKGKFFTTHIRPIFTGSKVER